MLPFELTKDTPYLALSGELWSVFCEYFNRNWSCYKGFLLYCEMSLKSKLLTLQPHLPGDNELTFRYSVHVFLHSQQFIEWYFPDLNICSDILCGNICLEKYDSCDDFLSVTYSSYDLKIQDQGQGQG